MKEKVAKDATRKKKKKRPTISLEDEPLSITNIVVRIWNVTDAMLTIKWHEHVGLCLHREAVAK